MFRGLKFKKIEKLLFLSLEIRIQRSNSTKFFQSTVLAESKDKINKTTKLNP